MCLETPRLGQWLDSKQALEVPEIQGSRCLDSQAAAWLDLSLETSPVSDVLSSSFSAPSQVVVLRQENTGQNSVTLLWHEPDQPNGIILEYEVKYYEKVTAICWPSPAAWPWCIKPGL